jgi:FkbM family methyltransferase
MRKSLLTQSGLQANAILQRLGLRLVRFPSPADRRRIQLIRNRSISMVIDIGANAGQYAKLLRNLGYRNKILSYEPLPEAFRLLAKAAHSDGLWNVSQTAVGDKAGKITMNIAENSVSSSARQMSSRHLMAAPDSGIVGSISVDCVSLDSIVSAQLVQPMLVKIDTQGFERNVLASGTGVIRSISLLELEMSFVELYHGQALFRELDSLLTRSGFKLCSIEEGFFDEVSGELLQCDAIYAQENSAW